MDKKAIALRRKACQAWGLTEEQIEEHLQPEMLQGSLGSVESEQSHFALARRCAKLRELTEKGKGTNAQLQHE